MKTILLIAFAGFIGVNCFAQDKSCSCPKKTVYHHKVHKKTVVASCKVEQPVVILEQVPEYMIENSFTGNYPLPLDINESLPAKTLIVTSSAFKNFGEMPSKYTCEGEQASPPLNISNVPQGTVSLAVVMYDQQANEKGSETYWLMWDLDTAGIIPENFVNNHETLNIAGEYGYHAVCPWGGMHYYHFLVYALDKRMNGNKHTTRADLEAAMLGHVLAKGELVGTYERL